MPAWCGKGEKKEDDDNHSKPQINLVASFSPTVMFLFMLRGDLPCTVHSTLAKIAASAAGELEHCHTQQLCCGDGDPKRGCVRLCGLLKTQTQMWYETSNQN